MTLAGGLARLATRHRRSVLACSLAIVIAGAVLGAGLELQTDLAELLPSRAPSVIALHELAARVGGTGNVAIAIESLDGSPGPLRAYVPRLAHAIRARLGRRVLSLRYSRSDVERFYRRFAAYYVPLATLDAWSRRAEHAIATRENPLYVPLDDGDDLATLAADLRRERTRLEPSNAADPETGLFMTEHGKLAVIFVRPAADSLDLAGSAALLDELRAIAAATNPAAAGVRIAGYTGSIPNAISEVTAVRHDIVSSALEVLLLVGAAIVLYFRSMRVLVALAAPLAIGAAVALGFARLAIGHLDAQTAFLGAIIVGTGINYGIILVARYQRTRGDVEAAIGHSLRATLVAALATAVAFGVLAAGEVESFRQFGWIGGIGILACWLATFLVVPAILVALPPRVPPPRRRSGPLAAFAAATGRACERFPRTILAAAACFTLAGIALAYSARDRAIETDLRKLATRSSAINGIERLDNRLRAMDDRSSTPAVIATHDRSEARPICDQLNRRAHSDLAGVVVRCYSIEDLFPSDLAARTPVLSRLHATLAKLDPDDVDAADRADLEELRRALAEPPPADRDLPPPLAEYFTERDGSLGKLLYVDPVDEHFEANLYKLTDAIRSIHLPSGATLESSGELVVFADVLRAVRRDARTLTLAAMVLVFVVLAAVTRRVAPFLRVSAALIAGVAVMLGFAVLTGQKLNFFNFVALPTTFGIGIDYAINIEERLRRATGSIAAATADAGPAVLLASLTSCLGYASLLGADSGALVSFGRLAIVGELACVLLAITIVPAAFAAARRA